MNRTWLVSVMGLALAVSLAVAIVTPTETASARSAVPAAQTDSCGGEDGGCGANKVGTCAGGGCSHAAEEAAPSD